MNAKIGSLGPRPHGVYSDRDRHGNPRISVTQPRKGRRGGKRSAYPDRACTQHRVPIPVQHPVRPHGKTVRLRCAIRYPSEYHTINEEAAVQMLLLIDAVRY